MRLRHRTIVPGLCFLVVLVLLASPTVTVSADARDLRSVWSTVQASGSYHFEADVRQWTVPVAGPTTVGRTGREEALHMEGETELAARRLQLTVWSQGGSVLDAGSGVEVRVEGDQAMARKGTQGWEEIPDFTGAVAPDGNFLAFLAAATDVEVGEPDGAGTQRYTFAIDGPRFAVYVRDRLQSRLTAAGELPPGVDLALPKQFAGMTGSGELWVGPDGLPVRQVLHLVFPAAASERTEADVVVNFNNFAPVPAARGAGAGGVVTQVQAALAPDVLQRAMLAALTVSGVVMLVIYRRSRVVRAAAFLALVVSMVVTPLLQSVLATGYTSRQAVKAAEQARQSDLERVVEGLGADPAAFAPNVSPLIQRAVDADPAAALVRDPLSLPSAATEAAGATVVDLLVDTDGDGLTDAEEALLGTVSDTADDNGDGMPDGWDTDGDLITDTLEVQGFAYGGTTWYVDPLEADTNDDAIADGREFWKADGSYPRDTDNDGVPDVHDRDNDGDGVPDGKDLSPFTCAATGFDEAHPFLLTVDRLNTYKYAYVEFQLRPTDAAHLWYAYNVLDWPEGDLEGQIVDGDGETFADQPGYTTPAPGVAGDANANGDMKLVPMLEIQLPDGTNLPERETLDQYGIALNELAGGGYVAYVPLYLVTDEGGERVAFQGKMIYFPHLERLSMYDLIGGEWGAAQPVRLVWTVQALLDEACTTNADGTIACTAYNQPQVIQAYPDAWTLTGLAVREDHGVDVAILYEDPAVDDNTDDDSSLWLAAAGLDRTFLSGRDEDQDLWRDVTVEEIARRFDHTTNAGVSADERWQIPNVLGVAVKSYDHLDAMLGGIATQDAAALLGDVFGEPPTGPVSPTLLFAREERFDAANLDLAGDGDAITWDGRSIRVKMSNTSATVQTLAGLSWAPYSYDAVSGAWQSYKIDDYWDELTRRYEHAFDDEPDPDIAAGNLLFAKLYYLALYSGAARTVQLGISPVSVRNTISDKPLGASMVNFVGVGIKYVTNVVFILAYRGVSVGGMGLTKYLGQFAREATPGYAVFAKFGKWLRAGNLKVVAAKTAGVLLVVALLVVVLVVFYKDLASEWRISLGVTAGVLLTLSLVVKPIVMAVTAIRALIRTGVGVASATARVLGSASEIAGASRAAGALGLLIQVAVIWGVFLYEIVHSNVQIGSIQFDLLLAQAISATVVAVVLFVLSCTVVGLIIVGIILVIDIVCMILGETGVSQWIGEQIADSIYGYELTLATDRSDLLEVKSFNLSLANAALGVVAGNAQTYDVRVRTNICQTFPDDAAVRDHVDDYYTVSNLRSSTFLYDLGPSKTEAINNTWWGSIFGLNTDYRDEMRDDWRDVYVCGSGGWNSGSVTLYGARADTHVSYTAANPQAGINRTQPLYLSFSYALPAVGCWKLCDPTGISQAFGSSGCVSSCSDKTVEGNDAADLGDFVIDILPTTLDAFYKLDWDALFSTPLDHDGDGLMAATLGGNDPDDTRWDTDGDTLSDAYELEQRAAGRAFDPLLADTDGDGLRDDVEARLGTAPDAADTDRDGLTDKAEVDGWAFTYAAGKQTWVTSDPVARDTDGDGLDDLAEYRLHMANAVAYPYNPNVYNEGPVTVIPEIGDADLYLAPGQTFPYTVTVRNDNTADIYTRGAVAVSYPAPLSGGLQQGAYDLFRDQTAVFSGNVTVAPAAGTQSVSIANVADSDLYAISPGATTSSTLGTVQETASASAIVDHDDPASVVAGAGRYLQAGSVTVVGGTAEDPTSYVAGVEVSEGGSTWEAATGRESWAYAWHVPVTEGAHTLVSRATDAVGNVETPGVGTPFIVDGTPPALTSHIADGTLLPATRDALGRWSLALSGTISDPAVGSTPGSGPQRVEVFVTPNGNGWQRGWVDRGGWTIDYALSPALVDATGDDYSVLVRAVDNVGNRTPLGDALRFTVDVDGTPPEATLTEISGSLPASVDLITQTVSFSGLVTDTGLLATGVDGVEVSLTPAELDILPDAWSGEYFTNTEVSGEPALVRFDPALAFDWGMGSPDVLRIPADGFSVRWTRDAIIQTSGTYRFVALHDDGLRITVDDVVVLDAWTATGDPGLATAEVPLRPGVHRLCVEYADRSDVARAALAFFLVRDQEWEAAYYNNDSLAGVPPVVRQDPQISFDWGHEDPVPGTIINDAAGFSVSWTREVYIPVAGSYLFTLLDTGGVRLIVDGRELVNAMDDPGVARVHTAVDSLSVGYHTVRLDYLETNRQAAVHLDFGLLDTWQPATTPGPGPLAMSWSSSVPEGVEGLTHMDVRGTDVLGNRNVDRTTWEAWRGEIDTLAPRVTVDIDYTGYGASAQTHYSCRAEDLNLDPDSFICPLCPASAVVRETYDTPWWRETFGDVDRLFRMTAACTVNGFDAPGFTVAACDYHGRCSEVSQAEREIPGARIYFIENGDTIKRAAVDGSHIETVVMPAQIEGGAVSLALDTEGGKLYWSEADWPAARIKRANLDGTGVELVRNTGYTADHLHVDADRTMLMWVEGVSGGNDVIQQVSLANPAGVPLTLDTGETMVDGLGADATYAYWGESRFPPREIVRLPLAGGSREYFSASIPGYYAATYGDPYLTDVTVDVGAGRVYYGYYDYECPMGSMIWGNESTKRCVVSTKPRVLSIDAVTLDPGANRVYYTYRDSAGGHIGAAAMDGTAQSVTPAISGLSWPGDLAIQSNHTPAAEGQILSVWEQTPRQIALSAYEPDGEPITWSLVTPPAHGSLTGTLPVVVYTSEPGMTSDAFTFGVADPEGNAHTAPVSITIAPLVDAAVLAPADHALLTSLAPVEFQGGASARDGLRTVTVTVDGGVVGVVSWDTVGVIEDTWSVTWTPAEGTHELSAIAEDQTGRVQTDLHPITVFVDAAAPTVEVTPLVLNRADLLDPGHVALQGTAQDSGGVRSVDLYLYPGSYLDGAAGGSDVTANITGETWQYALPVAGDENPAIRGIQARATDVAGRTQATVVDVVIDVVAPAPFTATMSYDDGTAWQPLAAGQTVYEPDATTLMLSWTASSDGAGLLGYWAGWTTSPTPNLADLTAYGPGVLMHTQHPDEAQRLYAHVGAEDINGNIRWQTLGPVVVDHRLTPDLVDAAGFATPAGPYTGWMASGCTLLAIDREAAVRAQAGSGLTATQRLYGTWDAEALRLAWTGADWDGDGDLFIYLDTQAGGSSVALDPYGTPSPVVNLPLEADRLVWVQDRTTATLLAWHGGAWVTATQLLSDTFRFDATVDPDVADLYLELASLGLTPGARFGLVAFATEEGSLRLWAAAPDRNPLNSARALPSVAIAVDAAVPLTLTHAYAWPALADDVCPSEGRFAGDYAQASLSADPAGVQVGYLQSGLLGLLTPGQPLDGDGDGQVDATLPVDRNPATLRQGQVVTYTIAYGNAGSGATDGLAFTATAYGGLVLAGGATTRVFDVGSVGAGVTGTVRVVGTVTGGASAELLVAVSDTPRGSYDWLWAQHPVDAVPPADLALSTPVRYVRPTTTTVRGSVTDVSGVPLVSLSAQPDGAPAQMTLCPDAVPDDGVWACLWNPGSLPEGTLLTLQAQATDSHGNTGAWSAPRELIVDGVSPVVTLAPEVEQLLDARPIGAHGVTFHGTLRDDFAVAEVVHCIDEGAAPVCTALQTQPTQVPEGTWQTRWLPAVGGDGVPVTMTLTGADVAGNTSLPLIRALRVDTVVPQLTATQAVTEAQLSDTWFGNVMVLTGSSSDGSGAPAVRVMVEAPSGALTWVTPTLSSDIWGCSPILREVGTYRLRPEARDLAGNVTPLDVMMVTVVDSAPATLTLTADGPTILGHATTLTATVSGGTNLTQVWDFGDGTGATISGDALQRTAIVTHTYPAASTYAVVVTATNDLGDAVAQVSVTVTNERPVADAGPDQGAALSDTVTLDGSGSCDADGHVPLAYAWTQVGGPGVLLSTSTISRPTFAAPGTPGEITFTLAVTDSRGLRALLPDTVVVSVDEPITGVLATADSPTRLGEPTSFTATVASGSRVVRTWDFGDGHTAVTSAAALTHTFAAPGHYPVRVRVENGAGWFTATLDVVVMSYAYLPLVAQDYLYAPDLVIDAVTVLTDGAQVVIRNAGTAPVVNAFWVDLYVDPLRVPTTVNETWGHVGTQGLAWGVDSTTLPLLPGDVLTLTVGDAAYRPEESYVAWPLEAGTPIYAQVDSADALTVYGGVLERHERLSEPYNNVFGPVTVGTGTLSSGATAWGTASAEDTALPVRPGSRRAAR